MSDSHGGQTEGSTAEGEYVLLLAATRERTNVKRYEMWARNDFRRKVVPLHQSALERLPPLQGTVHSALSHWWPR